MNIETGLFDHMVLQRRGNASDAPVTGATPATGRVLAFARRQGRLLPGWNGTRVGSAGRGRFTAHLKGIPTGGAYTIELRIVDRQGKTLDSTTADDVLVGDVWVVAGQSNMCGGGPADQKPVIKPLVRAFYMNDTWRPALDPITDHFDCTDEVHSTLAGSKPTAPGQPGSAGAAITCAQELHRQTGVPQGLISCAHGGTGMDQWSPALAALGGQSLYGAMRRRIRKNGGRIAGVLWYQGEGEAGETQSRVYQQRMKQFVSSIRRDTGSPRLPFAMVQLCRVVGPEFSAVHWDSVREQQRRLPDFIPQLTVVPAIDLPLGDLIHLNGHAQVRLGHRLAYAMRALIEGKGAGQPPLELKRVTFTIPYIDAHIRVEFGNVVGRLTCGDRPAGFSVLDAGGNERVFDVELQGNCALVKTTLTRETVAGATLRYGSGRDPYCNIRDQADRSLPAFGPVTIPGPRILTPFVTALRVSPVIPGRTPLKSLPHPGNLDRLDLGVRVFPGDFCNVHDQIAADGYEGGIVYFACAFKCAEPMDLSILLGYDGPLKLWLDGKARLTDADGKCPARADATRVDLRAARGRHDLLIALDANRGQAWGLFMRIERPPSRGRVSYVLPEILG